MAKKRVWKKVGNLPLRKKEKKQRLLKKRVTQIDLEKAKTASQILDAYRGMSIQARNLGTCAEVLEQMLRDKSRPTVMLGLAGPLIAGGLRKVIRDMIKYRMVDVVVSTGAILYQDFYQARGFGHYVGTPKADDEQLRDLLIDRIYDTYVDEEKFWETDLLIGRFADTLEPREYSSREFLWHLSALIKDEQSILYTARKHGVPVFSPALNDSSIGIGLTEHYHRHAKNGTPKISINSIRDNYELTQIVVKSRETAAVYVAGGIPKNYINDSVVMSYIFDVDTGGHKYALQVTTDSPHWGGLSGSTLSEAKSWGKVSKKATHAMAFIEPTVSLPLLVAHALQKKAYASRRRLKFTWDGDILKKLS